MPNPYFQFKQFTVFHDRCAMKVGTDGVLLGAWAGCRGASHILDVGTGSGLIALMLAQCSGAAIDALDMDAGACRQATYNVENSKFAGRIHVIHADFKDFTPDGKYDLIVSNPPYFSNSLQAPDIQRNLARHNQALPFEILIKKSAGFLTEKGKISLILPSDAENTIHTCAENNGLFLCRKTYVSPKPETPSKRILVEYSKIYAIPEISGIYIEKERHVYGEEFRRLTAAFYL